MSHAAMPLLSRATWVGGLWKPLIAFSTSHGSSKQFSTHGRSHHLPHHRDLRGTRLAPSRLSDTPNHGRQGEWLVRDIEPSAARRRSCENRHLRGLSEVP